ncbi:hypothetical protein B0H13DRAFT_1889727 [Mycena leptocephala]|nr:hypothetical protein B0H13DRAFT_1889727 [Mycena leptocephala]
MPPQKRKLTDEEVRERRAQAAWEYRQRNRQATNDKARLRMRLQREKLQTGSSRMGIPSAQPPGNQRQSQAPNATQEKSAARDVGETSDAQDTAVTAKLSANKAAPVAAAPAKILTPKKMPTLTKPRARTPPSPTPRSLGAITGDMSSSEDEGEDEEKSRSDDDGWEADNERDGLGRLLNHTGRPGYVPQPGQQPYFKERRRYWF